MNTFKKVILPIVGVALFIVVVGLFIRKSDNSPGWLNLSASPQVKMRQVTVKINDILIKSEVADTPELRKNGLSNRNSLTKDEGMLFIMDKTNTIPTFWMKDMKLSIDIIWIKSDKIIQIDKSIPAPKPETPTNLLKLYSPKTPVDYVLEVNSGFCSTNNFKVGDTVQIQSDL
jgi:uncharacterized membrane protein (UPF0127 family)